MRKAVWVLVTSAFLVFSILLICPPELLAQWGLIQQGVDAAKRGQQESARPAPPPWSGLAITPMTRPCSQTSWR